MRLAHDWYDGEVPDTVSLGADVYIDTAYSFAAFDRSGENALSLGRAAGVYDRTAFIVGPGGRVSIGDFTCLNACYIVCNRQICIGAFCMFAWGVTLTDTWLDAGTDRNARRAALADSRRLDNFAMPAGAPPTPVVVEDNVWVGFNAVVLPGVRLGRGAIVGANTIVDRDVAPYSVVVGNPVREIRQLEPTDTDEARRAALAECLRG